MKRARVERIPFFYQRKAFPPAQFRCRPRGRQLFGHQLQRGHPGDEGRTGEIRDLHEVRTPSHRESLRGEDDGHGIRELRGRRTIQVRGHLLDGKFAYLTDFPLDFQSRYRRFPTSPRPLLLPPRGQGELPRAADHCHHGHPSGLKQAFV